MHKKDQRLLKKILIAALATRPDSFGLVPDKKGWVKLKELAKTISQEPGFKYITPSIIEQFVLLWEKEIFELDVKTKQIRASSILRQDLSLEYEVSIPPDILFTAIRPRAYNHILKNGFCSKDSPIVFTSSKKLALRRGKWIHKDPILVTIKAFEATNNGSIFYKVGKQLFLSYYIAPQFIYIDAIPPKIKHKKLEKESKPERAIIETPDVETMGSFFLSSDFSFENKKKSSKLKKDKKTKRDPEWKRIRRQKRRR